MAVGDMLHTQLSNSAHQARAILGAWHSGDAHRLNVELNRVRGLRAVDSADEERLELLAEIAREMSSAAPGANDPVYGSLLEHLAFPQTRRTGAARFLVQ
jgi:hypothetical protein